MSDASLRGPVDFLALGRGASLPGFELRVSREEVLAYLEATGEPPDLWREHVPPLALGALTLAGLMARVAVPEGTVHTGQEYEFLRAVRIDQPLDVTLTVAARSERRGAVMTAFAAELRDGDEVVGRGKSTVLVAPPGVELEGDEAGS